MNNRLQFNLTLSLLLLLAGQIISSCSNNQIIEKGPFDVVSDLEYAELISAGFVDNKEFSYLSKQEKDYVVHYTYSLVGGGLSGEKEMIFSKSIHKMNFTADSIEIAEWVVNNRGIIISEVEKKSNRSNRFFIKGLDSGSVFQAILSKNNLQIFLDYPDTDKNQRSRYRSINQSLQTTYSSTPINNKK